MAAITNVCMQAKTLSLLQNLVHDRKTSMFEGHRRGPRICACRKRLHHCCKVRCMAAITSMCMQAKALSLLQNLVHGSNTSMTQLVAWTGGNILEELALVLQRVREDDTNLQEHAVQTLGNLAGIGESVPPFKSNSRTIQACCLGRHQPAGARCPDPRQPCRHR